MLRAIPETRDGSFTSCRCYSRVTFSRKRWVKLEEGNRSGGKSRRFLAVDGKTDLLEDEAETLEISCAPGL